MEIYLFENEQLAIDAEAWIVQKAKDNGSAIGAVGNTTQRYAIPMEQLVDEEPTGKWYISRIPEHRRSRYTEEDVTEFMTLFQPEIIEV